MQYGLPIFFCLYLSALIPLKGQINGFDSLLISQWHLSGMKDLSKTNSGRYETLRNEPFDRRFINKDSFTQYNFVEEFGGDNRGNKDNSETLRYALNATPDYSIIYFPSGTYLFTENIHIPSNRILLGRSPNTTQFLFNLDGKSDPLIVIEGQQTSNVLSLDTTNVFGRNFIQVNHNGLLQKGQWVEIEMENDASLIDKGESWSQFAIGEIYLIDSVNNQTVIFDRDITFNFDKYVKRRKRLNILEPSHTIGVERLTILREDSGKSATIKLNIAHNINLRCLYSKMAGTNHIEMEKTFNSVIFGSYFEDAYYHCTGGTGYGIWCGRHSSYNLIENNVLKRLRHSIIFSIGSNNNVISNNYSHSPYAENGSIQDPSGCVQSIGALADISVHGNYPYNNLFEQNVVYMIHVDDFWGKAGPNNTFFRNRIYREGLEKGIRIDNQNNQQNIIANVLPYSSLGKGNISNHITSANVQSTTTDNTSNTSGLPLSLYIEEKPFYWTSDQWPVIGPEYNVNSFEIPPRSRYFSGNYFDSLCCGTIPELDNDYYLMDDFLIVFEDGDLFIESTDYIEFDLYILDIKGAVLLKIPKVSTNEPISLSQITFPKIFLIRIQNQNMSKTFKIATYN